jgi:hypothetical protein
MSHTTQTEEPSRPDAAHSKGTVGFQVTRTELVWPGNYNEDGSRKEVPRVGLPFQVIETINESRASRHASNKSGTSVTATKKERNNIYGNG